MSQVAMLIVNGEGNFKIQTTVVVNGQATTMLVSNQRNSFKPKKYWQKNRRNYRWQQNHRSVQGSQKNYVPKALPTKSPEQIEAEKEERRTRLLNNYYEMWYRYNNYEQRMLRGEVEAPNPYAKPLDPRKNPYYKHLFE